MFRPRSVLRHVSSSANEAASPFLSQADRYRQDIYTSATAAWVDSFVLKYALCPFADMAETTLYSYVSKDMRDIGMEVMAVSAEMTDASSRLQAPCVMIVAPHLGQFQDMLTISHDVQEMLTSSGLEDDVSLATFHPRFQYDGTDATDAGNYTNRSPFPVFQLIKYEYILYAMSKNHNWDTSRASLMQRGHAQLERELKALRAV